MRLAQFHGRVLYMDEGKPNAEQGRPRRQGQTNTNVANPTIGSNANRIAIDNAHERGALSGKLEVGICAGEAGYRFWE